MGKTKRDASSSVEESFHKHYAAIWGEERWHKSLYPALAEKTRYAALINRYSSSPEVISSENEQLEQIAFPMALDNRNAVLCYARKHHEKPSEGVNGESAHKTEASLLPPPNRASDQGLMTHWNLDAASALAAHLLDVQPGDDILDLCAAPGGKSVALAQNLWPQLHVNRATNEAVASSISRSGNLRSNEADRTRHKRLAENLTEYLPKHAFESKNVTSLNIDGTEPYASRKLAVRSQGFDKVLVDAPCSSERHIIHAHNTAKGAGQIANEMANWRPGSSKRLAKTQLELLITGVKAAKVNGCVLYATCSIEPTENDGVVEKILAWAEKEVKKGSKWTVKLGDSKQRENELETNWAEKTNHGWIVLPDHLAGGKWGPLFFVLLKKVLAEE